MEAYNNVLEAMEDYYKLKSAYMIRLENSKDTIKKNNNLNMKQKKDRIRALAPKCIICNKPVGTIFLNQNRKLIAKCGATADMFKGKYEPCNLNIDIYKGRVETKDILYKEQKENKDISSLTIIKLKLDLIFKYLSEEETLEKFDEVIQEYESESDYMNTFTEELIKIKNRFINKPRIDAIVKENKEHFLFMREALNTYNESKEPSIINDIVQRYIQNVIPNIKEQRKLQYDYYEVETEDNVEFRLVKIENSISSLENINEEPQINSNIQ